MTSAATRRNADKTGELVFGHDFMIQGGTDFFGDDTIRPKPALPVEVRGMAL
ncbi:MAG: hypothetical protein ACAH88_04995 [Roseimicrobium sp.]